VLRQGRVETVPLEHYFPNRSLNIKVNIYLGQPKDLMINRVQKGLDRNEAALIKNRISCHFLCALVFRAII